MQLYHDQDADLGMLEGKRIAVIGYGNQGRAQALNLRDGGLDVVVGNREDEFARQAGEDGLAVLSIGGAAAEAGVVLLLIPDEVMPEVFEAQIAPHLAEGTVLVFASGYNIAFGRITPPPSLDVVLVAPRMIGAGVRDLYLAGRGFPSFIGVEQDHSGQARAIALALAKGIGSTRMGVVEVTFAQEAELDLFTEQCFGPAFGQVLTTSVNLLLDEGYPPEAVLLELYMSGELSYTLAKIAELGLVEQTSLHSRTSQYGSMSRGMRFILPELRTKMQEGLAEIRSGQFAQEWAEEQAAGAPTLAMLKEAARSLPLHRLEHELRDALNNVPVPAGVRATEGRDAGGGASHKTLSRAEVQMGEPDPERGAPPPASSPRAAGEGGLRGLLASLLGQERRSGAKPEAPGPTGALSAAQMEAVLGRFLACAIDDPALQAFGRGREMTTHYVLTDAMLEFHMRFNDGLVSARLGEPASLAEVRLETEADVLDGMFTGQINAMRAAMTGKLTFSGDARLAMSIQQIQGDLSRLYVEARRAVVGRQ
jgi:ketol-acid reductoisomerase